MITAASKIQDRILSIQERKLEVDALPVCAKIEVSGLCNLRCKFCFKSQEQNQSARSRNMSQEDFQQALDFVKTIPTVQEVGLFYIGESTLNPLMPKFFQMLKQENFFTFLTTNATNRDCIIQALPYIDSLKVSFNYKSVDDFVQKTGSTKATFDSIVANIKEFAQVCHQQGKRISMSALQDSAPEEYASIFQTLGVDDQYWLPTYSFNGQNADGQVGNSNPLLRPFAKCSGMPCWSLFNTLYIDSQLNVRTCSFSVDDNQILYNIKDTPKFFLSDQMLDMREKHLQGKVPLQCMKCLQ